MTFDYESNTTVLNSKVSEAPEDWDRLEIFYRNRLTKITRDKLPFTIGRGDNCDLQVYSDVASRQHCEVSSLNGQIGVKDSSTNGTFVQFGRADEIMVKDDFSPLTGQGRLSLGKKLESDDPNIILFKVIRQDKP